MSTHNTVTRVGRDSKHKKNYKEHTEKHPLLGGRGHLLVTAFSAVVTPCKQAAPASPARGPETGAAAHAVQRALTPSVVTARPAARRPRFLSDKRSSPAPEERVEVGTEETTRKATGKVTKNTLKNTPG